MGNACAVDNDDIVPHRRQGLRAPSKSAPGWKPQSQIGTHAHAIGKVKDRQDFNSQDLIEACMVGDCHRTKWSLQARADVNVSVQPIGLQAIHIVAAQGDVANAQMLLEYQADFASASNKLGLTPLCMAAKAGHREMVRLLVSSSAPLDGPREANTTPLLEATLANYADICDVLIAASADINRALRQSVDAERVESLKRRGISNDWKEVLKTHGLRLEDPMRVEGFTPLHAAAYHGSVRTCDFLIDVGARLGAVDVLLRSALMVAGERGHTAVTTLLLEHKAAIGADCQKHTVATLAARAGHAAILRLLVDYRILEVNKSAWVGGPTMLHVAAAHGHGACVSLLCEQDADVGLPMEPGGMCPLMLAAARGNLDTCQELLAYGAMASEVDDEGRSVWMHAAAEGKGQVCDLLSKSYGHSESVTTKHRSRPANALSTDHTPFVGPMTEAPGRVRVARDAEDIRPAVTSAAIMAGVPAIYAGRARGFANADRAAGPAGL